MMNERISRIEEILKSGAPEAEIRERLNGYHENDIAAALRELDRETRLRVYHILGIRKTAEIFAYMEDAASYLKELPDEQMAAVLDNMDSDDAVDILESIEDGELKLRLLALMEASASGAVRLINSYDSDEIGSMMTTNFIKVGSAFTVKETMKTVIGEARENDNISTIYVEDANGAYYGAIDLRDLIIAREHTSLDAIISRNYPALHAEQKISEVLERLKDYAEDSFPVLDKNERIIGIITAQDVIEAVNDAMAEDYARMGGLSEGEDLNEKVLSSMKKRMPWLLLLLFLGMGVSSVVGAFETIVSQMAVVMCFQSLILDMSGNVGTQSLAVTIRVLTEENVGRKEKLKLILKETQIGGANGLVLGFFAVFFVSAYLYFAKGYAWSVGFQISACVGAALFLAMTISSFTGTMIPIFFHKVKIDPAVASGPLITTVDDMVAVVTYYGLVTLFLIGV